MARQLWVGFCGLHRARVRGPGSPARLVNLSAYVHDHTVDAVCDGGSGGQLKATNLGTIHASMSQFGYVPGITTVSLFATVATLVQTRAALTHNGSRHRSAACQCAASFQSAFLRASTSYGSTPWKGGAPYESSVGCFAWKGIGVMDGGASPAGRRFGLARGLRSTPPFADERAIYIPQRAKA